MKGNWVKKVGVSLMCLAMVTGCGSTTTGAKEAIVNLTQEPPEMDSILTTSSGSMNVLRHCVEGLVVLDAKDQAQPGVATEWKVSEDKKTYTFKLRQGQKWSNGEEVTAKDFVFAWNTHFTKATGAPYASTWMTKIAGAADVFNAKDDAALETALANAGWKAVDDYTFEVTFTGPYPYALVMMAFPSFFPVNEKAYKDAGGTKKYGTSETSMAYNGPYKMTSWAHEDSIVLEKNPEYWNADSIKLEKITFKMINNMTTAVNEYNNGSIDMTNLDGENSKLLKEQGKNPQSFDDGGAWYLEFNSQMKELGLNNKKVRKGITMAIDAKAMVESVLQNHSKVATTLTPECVDNGEFKKFTGDLLVRDGDYAAAKVMLEEGLKEEGLTLDQFTPTLLCDDTSAAKKQAEFLQAQFKDNLGVKLEVKQVTYKARLAAMDSGDFDIVFAGWSPDYNDPMSYMDMWLTGGGNNHGKWSNARYDELIAKADVTADKNEYYSILKEAEQILADECPIGFVYARQTDFITSDKLKGVVRTAFQDINLNYAYIEE